MSRYLTEFKHMLNSDLSQDNCCTQIISLTHDKEQRRISPGGRFTWGLLRRPLNAAGGGEAELDP